MASDLPFAVAAMEAASGPQGLSGSVAAYSRFAGWTRIVLATICHFWLPSGQAGAFERAPERRTSSGARFQRLTPASSEGSMTQDLWYKNAVIYCLNIETFQESNGDGAGDFRGLMRRLDYLQGLGVTAIWLMPFQPSPRRDRGYDISDYYNVDSRFGTLGDFVEFTHGAKQRGIRVIIDLVVNHTSDQHPWFREARTSPESLFRNWYIWSKDEPADPSKGVVFQGIQEATWSYDDEAKAWYFHRFFGFQPDLNTTNPEVRAEILKIMGFWIQLGVDGFRVDAVPFLIGGQGPDGPEPGKHPEFLRTMREFLQWRRAESIFLAEANVPPDKSLEYFGRDGERLQMVFNFHVNQHLFLALATQEAQPLADAIRATLRKPDVAQWAQFLRNHDELDLGRLTDAQQTQVIADFAPEPDMQVYGRGIRRRLAPMLAGDRSWLEMAYSLLFALPGTPVIRYGDEIGIGDDLALPEREAGRTPMQWSSEAQGGFTTSDGPIRPVIADGPYGYHHVNVAAQRHDLGSLLNWMERLIRTRKEVPEIGWGDVSVIDSSEPAVLILSYEWRGSTVVTLHNLNEAPREVRFRPNCGPRGHLLASLLSDERSHAEADGRHRVVMKGHGYRWYRAGGLDDVLSQTENGR